MGKEPLYHEIRQESPFVNSVMEDFNTLKIVNGELRKEIMDDEGNVTSLLVCPESISRKIVKHLHVSMAHSNCWRLASFIHKIYFIPRLNSILREVYCSCASCLLSQAPKAQKGRDITVSSSSPGREISVDLIYLPPSNGFLYAMVATDCATSYCFARPMRGRSSKEAAECLLDIMYSNSFLCQVITTDDAVEFKNHFQTACAQTAASHIVNSVLVKNSIKTESTNARLVNLLRRLLTDESQWPKRLQQTVFALNVCSMRYGDFITTPSQLFNNRCLAGVPALSSNVEDSVIASDKSLRSIMTKVTKHRLADTPSLAVHLSMRKGEFRVGQKVLVWAERILAKKLLKNSILKIKLSKFWRIAKVTKILGRHCMVETEDGKLRKMHVRQMKEFPDSAA